MKTFTMRQVLKTKNTRRQITNQKIYNVWIFETESLRCVRFRKESFKTSLDFESKLLQRVRTSIKRFQCVGSGIKISRRCKISHQKTRNERDFQMNCYNMSDFESNALQFVGFQIKNFTICQLFERKFCKIFNFWIKKFTKWPKFNKKFTTCEISYQNFNNVSDVEAKN